MMSNRLQQVRAIQVQEQKVKEENKQRKEVIKGIVIFYRQNGVD